jgi:hypothetical protein
LHFNNYSYWHVAAQHTFNLQRETGTQFAMNELLRMDLDYEPGRSFAAKSVAQARIADQSRKSEAGVL